MNTEAGVLYETVIKKGYCIGCGACALVENSPFTMEYNKYGNIEAKLTGDLNKCTAEVLEICPFSAESLNEDEVSNLTFGEVSNKDARIGKYIECFAGHVTENGYREKGSSGGIGKWLGNILLKENRIDYFIQVVSNRTQDPAEPLFAYKIFGAEDNVLEGSKSSYYPVSLDEILKTIRKKEGRYAITGVPCFIKTIRLLALKDKLIKSRIIYTIGIVCGGMKSANQSKMIGWQLGVKPENLSGIDFRRKHPTKPASHKIYQVWSNADQKERFKDSFEIFGTDWGKSYFKPKACDYCDDVVSETADISIGDAWLPEFVGDPKGSTIVIVRHKELLEIINRFRKDEILSLVSVSADEVAKSQAGGLRHRREALSFRIEKKEDEKKWYPPKRIKAGDFQISDERKKIYSLREKIAQHSHVSFRKALDENNLEIFFREMRPLEKEYNVANNGKLPIRIYKRFKYYIYRLLNPGK